MCPAVYKIGSPTPLFLSATTAYLFFFVNKIKKMLLL